MAPVSDASLRNSDGETALMIASRAFIAPGWTNCNQSAPKCIAMLLSGADLAAVDSEGFTALGGFLRRVGFVSIAPLSMGGIHALAMIEALCAKIDPRAPCEPSGLSALDYAISRGDGCAEEIRRLLEQLPHAQRGRRLGALFGARPVRAKKTPQHLADRQSMLHAME